MFKLFKNFTKKDYLLIFISFIFILVQVWLDLKLPDYMSEITKLVQTEGSKMSAILENGGYMLLCAFGSLLSAILVGYISSNVSASFSKTIRKKLFNKVENLGVAEVKNFSTSSLITRTTNDITQIQMFISMGLQLLIKAPVTAIWAVTKILNKNIAWSAVTSVAVIILLVTILALMSIVMPRFKRVQKLTDKLNGVTRENLTGIRVVRAFNAEKYQEDKFSKVNNELTNTQLFNQKAFAIMQPIMYLVMYFLTLSIYFIGADLINKAMMSDKLSLFSDMVVFSSYSMQVIMSFLMLAMIFMMLPRASVSAKRINEVLDTELSIKDGKFTGDTKETGTVEFKNVSFKYPDAEEYLLKDISFKANKGETVAFIGSTGSGKSSLINLIPRFYDATDGEVLVDGVDVKEYKQESLRNKISYVPQKAILFHGTVSSNVSFGDNGKGKIKAKKIEEAVRVAQAEEFVSKMDKTYDAAIAQGGTNVSGGQKQRLSIARAVARDPEIYIFDDSFSALDYKTDYILRKELKNYTKDATSLIVAQRIGTIMNADKILVLDNGKCVGMGTHKELLKTCDVYKQIALSQLSKEELENA
ncbi:MAG: ABC transporter ATP-binding protein [Clostridium sp.]|nr:ABC transporter ATP-binding protein [Clostridium sp.]